MKKTIKKVFVHLLVVSTLLSSATPALAKKITVNMPYTIYETEESQHISSGVVHENIMRFTSSGWWNINVLRIDLNDEYTEIKGLFNPNGIPNRDKVSNLVDKHNAVAAVNGDFFNYKPLPSAMGTLINDGEVISSPIEMAYALPTFFIDTLNKGNITYLDRRMAAINENTGKQVLINTINKVTQNFDTVTLLNKHWGTKSIGTRFHKDLVEVVVENDIVTDVRVGKEAVNIPQNGYILAVRGEKQEGLLGFSVGDPVKLDITTTPNIENIKFAIGGGSIILKDGELSLTNINIKGNEPRTGIGINKEGDQLLLVTIDGRDSSFKGVSQEMFGALLKELGAYNALNLDGGGSTTMAVKPANEEKAKVVNKPSDGGERSVVNGVGVISNAPKGELSYIKVLTDDTKMFVNTTRKFSVKGYDKYHNPVEIDQNSVVYSHEGVEGTITGNSFKASSEGTAKIIANYNGITSDTSVKVLEPVRDITTNTSSFNLDINSQKTLGDFYGKDKNGFQAKIYPEDITFTITGNIGYIEKNIFYSGEKAGGGAITAKIGDGIENILVSVGNKGILVEGFESLENFKFASYPESVTGGISLSKEAKDGNSSVALRYDFSKGDNTRAAYLNLTPKGNAGLTFTGAPKKLSLWVNGDNSGSWLRGTLKDSKGTSHTIDFAKTIDWTGWQYLTANIPSNVSYPVTLERIYVTEIDDLKKHSGEILLDSLSALYPSTYGNMALPTPSNLTDDKNVKTEVTSDGFSFIVSVEPKGIDKLVGYDASSKIKSRINNHKIGVFLNGVSDEFKKGLKNNAVIDTNKAYTKNKHKGVLFINLSSAKGGIRATNPQQWQWLTNDLLNEQDNNIVLFLPTPIFGSNGFTDTLEAELLHKNLVEAKERGKNIFVVHGGNSTSSDLKDGVRYIQLNTKGLNAPDDIYNLSVIEFVVNGNDISYQINSLFENPKVKVN
ncbi:phosphodiester glycosidase family protein [Tissierella sp. MSJ-40]|uniref:Phosphodiester glycosidase family protein n=1 Tax=Tissierella simiarum TaxID=2841534 RepID=A0ABS6E1D5_9FIRM|nr:phosphodiester glycosidase family protein [Tissierella simiarum]MBU5436711.1 phosphodiester glycosidase family protein [Tissierella simiarum]